VKEQSFINRPAAQVSLIEDVEGSDATRLEGIAAGLTQVALLSVLKLRPSLNALLAWASAQTAPARKM
jgi:hypothetical protein